MMEEREEVSFECLQDIEDFARAKLDQDALLFYGSGAHPMQTLKENREAFARYRLLPRCLVDVSSRSTATSILAHAVDIPVGIAPTAIHGLAHDKAEVATALAAQKANVVFVQSSGSTCSIEEVAAAAPDAIKWFQISIRRDREMTLQWVRRAELCGFSAIVVTVDAPMSGIHHSRKRPNFKVPSQLKQGNCDKDYVEKAPFIVGKGDPGGYFDQSLTWKDIEWLVAETKLPVIIKGILRADDAIKAVNAGASAIIVSNHGGRQLDGAPATIDCLKSVRAAVGNGKCEVYMDGGVRTGTDVLKALALGAKMVFVGRPVIWGLAYNGQKGVELTLEILKDELDMAMALAGVPNVRAAAEDQSLVVLSQSCLP